MTFADTNVVLRWLLNDHAVLSPKAQNLIKTAETKDNEFLITDVVLGEIFYVLRQKGYKNDQIAQVIGDLLERSAFIFDQESMLSLLVKVIAETRLDFADCYLISRAVYSNKPLATFDNSMLRAYHKYKTTKADCFYDKVDL